MAPDPVVGIGWRHAHYEALLAERPALGFIEVHAENFFADGGVTLAVLQAVERGDFTLDTPLRVRASDYVDGAGQTNSKPVGRALSVRYLLEQMLIYSDNTASDMLIGLVGIRAVNALVQQLVPRPLREAEGGVPLRLPHARPRAATQRPRRDRAQPRT